MPKEVVSVGIYVDALFPDIDADKAFAGIELIRAISPVVKVEREVRSVKCAFPSPEYINIDNHRWPQLDSDLNVLLTGRRLVADEYIDSDGSLRKRKLARNKMTVGFAFSNDRLGSNKIAAVDVINLKRADLGVAHEIGHLLGVALRTNEGEKEYHCQRKSCIMALDIRDTNHERSFCSDCSVDLHQNTKLFTRARKHTSPNAYLPWISKSK